MADTLDNTSPARRRRSDARRSIDAIVSAARTVLAGRPDASMEEIATAAGVTRQTVYAHFPSREALITALLHVAGAETVAAMDAASLGTAAPAQALRRYLDIGWQLIGNHPFLLGHALARSAPGDAETHEAGVATLEQIIQRGQRTGEFGSTLPPWWLAVAVVGLVRTAAEQVAGGRLTISQAAPMVEDGALRLCGAAGDGPVPADLRRDGRIGSWELSGFTRSCSAAARRPRWCSTRTRWPRLARARDGFPWSRPSTVTRGGPAWPGWAGSSWSA